MQLLSMQLSQASSYFLHLRSKYHSRPTILDQTLPMSIPQCETPSFNPIIKNRQN